MIAHPDGFVNGAGLQSAKNCGAKIGQGTEKHSLPGKAVDFLSKSWYVVFVKLIALPLRHGLVGLLPVMRARPTLSQNPALGFVR